MKRPKFRLPQLSATPLGRHMASDSSGQLAAQAVAAPLLASETGWQSIHLIVAHAVTNDGSDRAQLAGIACQAKEALGVDELQAVADRGYFDSDEILACHKAGVTVTLPKPMTSNAKAEGRFGKQDFRYVAEEEQRDVRGIKAGAPSISQLTAVYGRPARAGAREGRCACGCARSPGGTLCCTSDDGAHL
jgi:hypothetical protein